jgi:hypothetical protein
VPVSGGGALALPLAFFTELGADGRAKAFNENRAEVLEKEIDQAVAGGLDYWASRPIPNPRR